VANQFSEQFTITGVTAYPSTPQVSAELIPAMVILQNRDDASVYFSFDGTNDHGQIQEGESISISPASGYGGAYSRVWLREANDGTAAVVRVSLYA
jgi:hypothetical protein